MWTLGSRRTFGVHPAHSGQALGYLSNALLLGATQQRGQSSDSGSGGGSGTTGTFIPERLRKSAGSGRAKATTSSGDGPTEDSAGDQWALRQQMFHEAKRASDYAQRRERGILSSHGDRRGGGSRNDDQSYSDRRDRRSDQRGQRRDQQEEKLSWDKKPGPPSGARSGRHHDRGNNHRSNHQDQGGDGRRRGDHHDRDGANRHDYRKNDRDDYRRGDGGHRSSDTHRNSNHRGRDRNSGHQQQRHNNQDRSQHSQQQDRHQQHRQQPADPQEQWQQRKKKDFSAGNTVESVKTFWDSNAKSQDKKDAGEYRQPRLHFSAGDDGYYRRKRDSDEAPEFTAGRGFSGKKHRADTVDVVKEEADVKKTAIKKEEDLSGAAAASSETTDTASSPKGSATAKVGSSSSSAPTSPSDASVPRISEEEAEAAAAALDALEGSVPQRSGPVVVSAMEQRQSGKDSSSSSSSSGGEKTTTSRGGGARVDPFAALGLSSAQTNKPNLKTYTPQRAPTSTASAILSAIPDIALQEVEDGSTGKDGSVAAAVAAKLIRNDEDAALIAKAEEERGEDSSTKVDSNSSGREDDSELTIGDETLTDDQGDLLVSEDDAGDLEDDEIALDHEINWKKGGAAGGKSAEEVIAKQAASAGGVEEVRKIERVEAVVVGAPLKSATATAM